MLEICLSGSGGGKGKRSLVQYWHATAPLLDLITRAWAAEPQPKEFSILFLRLEMRV